jgi:hypothetical protein
MEWERGCAMPYVESLAASKHVIHAFTAANPNPDFIHSFFDDKRADHG